MRSTWFCAAVAILALHARAAAPAQHTPDAGDVPPADARAAAPIPAEPPATPPVGGDIPEKFEPVTTLMDFEKREVMIPMRDGVKLFTIIVIPKGASHAPMILDRTPYSASKFVSRAPSPHAALALPTSFGELAEAGYIIVSQDVRGKYKSEGAYVMNRPLVGPLNSATSIIRPTPTTPSTGWSRTWPSPTAGWAPWARAMTASPC